MDKPALRQRRNYKNIVTIAAMVRFFIWVWLKDINVDIISFSYELHTRNVLGIYLATVIIFDAFLRLYVHNQYVHMPLRHRNVPPPDSVANLATISLH